MIEGDKKDIETLPYKLFEYVGKPNSLILCRLIIPSIFKIADSKKAIEENIIFKSHLYTMEQFEKKNLFEKMGVSEFYQSIINDVSKLEHNKKEDLKKRFVVLCQELLPDNLNDNIEEVTSLKSRFVQYNESKKAFRSIIEMGKNHRDSIKQDKQNSRDL